MAERLGDTGNEDATSPNSARRDSQTAEKVSRACDNCKVTLRHLPISKYLMQSLQVLNPNPNVC